MKAEVHDELLADPMKLVHNIIRYFKAMIEKAQYERCIHLSF